MNVSSQNTLRDTTYDQIVREEGSRPQVQVQSMASEFEDAMLSLTEGQRFFAWVLLALAMVGIVAAVETLM